MALHWLLHILMASWAVLALERGGFPAQPADHLVPPPLPLPLSHHSSHPPALPTPQRLTHATAGLGSTPVVAPAPPPTAITEPGFMTRVARWFGLGGGAPSSGKDQQLSPSNSLSYAYPKPGQSFDAASGKPCSLCNKYPWVPMVGHPQHPQQQQQQQQQQPLQVQQQQLWHLQQPQQQQQQVAQASQQRQRAVQFQSTPPQIPNFLPLAVPMPPLYNAQPFRPSAPKENIVSESIAVPVAGPVAGPLPTHPPSTSTFEIVKSHQVTDFVTSVEYPATFVQSHAIDLGSASTSQKVLPDPSEPSTVRYQLEDLASGQVHQHLPASQLLTELGHFVETTTVLPPPPADNYPAASSQLQHLQQEQDHEQEQDLYYAEQEETSTLIYGPTTTEAPTTTMTPQQPPQAIELNNHLAAGMPNYRQGISRGRETPKRLLDSPINHAGGRPFTRDPADLNFRLSQAYTPTQPPTPTSTYGAIDASGQYAGMSPPNPKQVIIPYTTRQRPRPFESWTPLRTHRPSANDLEEEPHEQQESKLATATVTAPNSRRTTKYLTKILASNLRELLKRERETKRLPGQSLGVDLFKLQHNIDGWTEQEYNSLSHRPSTPTIRGRSKHIPTEYLTTTTTTTTPAPQRQSKTTRGEGFELGGAPPTVTGDLSTSINNLEQLHLLGERGSKRFQHLDDNRLHFDYYDARPKPTQAMASSTTSSSPAPPTTTTTTEVTPLYVRSTTPPKELWKQLQVAILPQTNEKVYVVTPQPPTAPPRHKEHHEAEASAPRPVYQTPAPRFPRMRPTPAGEVKAATPTSSSQLRNYTPDIFGLMGLSAYVPAEPVEIIDGNSKVITIVTAAPTAAALQRPTPKPTIAPSPR
ncbi:histone-lysine N-methyltransferase 2D isoform X1 [Drosophila ananassae]|uniref:histone-lysine N-methyltransferase 2D isoform X1 n=2 Tax=Drosophila ananassae TaxID=7217 RepID=UPI0013A5CF19|nr:histone-lysine N-methyltransferase 2D isoform X1 [Drosophila ananassae]